MSNLERDGYTGTVYPGTTSQEVSCPQVSLEDGLIIIEANELEPPHNKWGFVLTLAEAQSVYEQLGEALERLEATDERLA